MLQLTQNSDNMVLKTWMLCYLKPNCYHTGNILLGFAEAHVSFDPIKLFSQTAFNVLLHESIDIVGLPRNGARIYCVELANEIQSATAAYH